MVFDVVEREVWWDAGVVVGERVERFVERVFVDLVDRCVVFGYAFGEDVDVGCWCVGGVVGAWDLWYDGCRTEGGADGGEDVSFGAVFIIHGTFFPVALGGCALLFSLGSRFLPVVCGLAVLVAARFCSGVWI